MKRIGILLSSTKCNKFLYETISELAKSKQVEIIYLLNRNDNVTQGIWRKVKCKFQIYGLVPSLELGFFKLLTFIERKILNGFFQKGEERKEVFSIDEFTENARVYLMPAFSTSGRIVRYPPKDIEKIRSLDLDLIIRGNAPGIFSGDILTSTKEGIISFFYADNRWNRGGPPAFWEVYLRKPSTGFIIQRLTEKLGAGDVLFRGNIPTRSSYTRNVDNLYKESNPHLAKLVLKYAASNHMPSLEAVTPLGGTFYRAPSFAESVVYLLRTFMQFFTSIIRRLFLRQYMRWSVAFINGSWQNATLEKGVRVTNPPGHFFADPFVVTKNNTTVCFVEDYSYIEKRGCIAAIEIIDDRNYRILGPVIEESFHMSFPYLFEYEHNLYMIPETSQANSIRLYVCIDFPLIWKYQKDIMVGCRASDSMLFKIGERWWLLTNMTTDGNIDHCSQLYAYYSKHPFSNEWIAHDLNPLVFDSSNGRNGGILDAESMSPVRGRQKQGFALYGAALSLAKITNLTPSSFCEQEIGRVLPNFFHKIKGCHHMHSNGKFTVYDYCRFENLK